MTGGAVPENAPAGSYVGTVTSSDADGDAVTLSLSGNSSTDNALFSLDATGRISINVSPDYEAKNSYKIEIVASDGKAQNSGLFDVTVSNVNESPVITGVTNLLVPENNAAGALLGLINAQDPEGDSLSFQLVSGAGDEDNSSFEIAGNEIRILNSLNYEQKNAFSFRIQASDGNGGSESRSFTLVVTNVNEDPAALVLSNNSVKENESAADVGVLTAVDPDGDFLSYSLTAGTGDEDNASFEIVDGNKLRLKAAADFEAKSSYSVRVAASDNRGGEISGTFSVVVTNVNEAPFAPSLSKSEVEENQAQAEVGLLSSTDPDAADVVSFRLVEGAGDDDNAAFTVSGNTLKLKASADYEAKNSYSVRVEAIDAGGLASASSFSVSVKDVNEAPTSPAISSSLVEENAGTGAFIGTLSSSDADGDIMIFSLVSGTGDSDNAAFEIDGDRLVLKESADFETKKSYSIRVQASDNRGGVTSEIIIVSVTNVNEAPRVSLQAQTIGSEDEAIVVQASVTDGETELKCSSAVSVRTSSPSVVASVSGDSSACSISLTPSANFNGGVTLLVTATDSDLTTQESSYVYFAPRNDAPVYSDVAAGHRTLSLNKNEEATVLMNGASDVDTITDGQALSYVITQSPSNGTLMITDDPTAQGGAARYTPTNNFYGLDSFSYQVCDNASPLRSCTPEQVVFIEVINPNTAPSLSQVSVSLSQGDLVCSALDAFDAQGDVLIPVATFYRDSVSLGKIYGTAGSYSVSRNLKDMLTTERLVDRGGEVYTCEMNVVDPEGLESETVASSVGVSISFPNPGAVVRGPHSAPSSSWMDDASSPITVDGDSRDPGYVYRVDGVLRTHNLTGSSFQYDGLASDPKRFVEGRADDWQGITEPLAVAGGRVYQHGIATSEGTSVVRVAGIESSDRHLSASGFSEAEVSLRPHQSITTDYLNSIVAITTSSNASSQVRQDIEFGFNFTSFNSKNLEFRYEYPMSVYWDNMANFQILAIPYDSSLQISYNAEAQEWSGVFKAPGLGSNGVERDLVFSNTPAFNEGEYVHLATQIDVEQGSTFVLKVYMGEVMVSSLTLEGSDVATKSNPVYASYVAMYPQLTDTARGYWGVMYNGVKVTAKATAREGEMVEVALDDFAITSKPQPMMKDGIMPLQVSSCMLLPEPEKEYFESANGWDFKGQDVYDCQDEARLEYTYEDMDLIRMASDFGALAITVKPISQAGTEASQDITVPDHIFYFSSRYVNVSMWELQRYLSRMGIEQTAFKIRFSVDTENMPPMPGMFGPVSGETQSKVFGTPWLLSR